MTVNQVISSCQYVYEYAAQSELLRMLLVGLFFVFPVIKVLISVLKTNKKIKITVDCCAQKLPKKLVTIANKHSINESDFLLSCEQKPVAASIGFVSKKIIISSFLVKKLSPKELEAVVLHERHHSKFFHSSVLLLAETITEVFFFIPVLKDTLVILRTEFEKSADSAAVRYQKTNKYVKNALKKMIGLESNLSIYPQFAHYILTQRIDTLNNKKTQMNISFKRTVLSICSFLFFFIIYSVNSRYALASTINQKITCSLINCVQDCVAQELLQNTSFQKKPMSEINFSVDR